MTVTFDQKRLLNSKIDLDLPHTNVSLYWHPISGLYHDFCKETYKHHYREAKFHDRWPMLLAGMDFEGSRVSRRLGYDEYAKANRNLHIHGYWLVSPQAQQEFERFFFQADLRYLAQDYGPVDAIEVKRFDRAKDGLDYILKGHVLTQALAVNSDDLRLYPNPDPAQRRIHYPYELRRQHLSRQLTRQRVAVRKDRHEWRDHEI